MNASVQSCASLGRVSSRSRPYPNANSLLRVHGYRDFPLHARSRQHEAREQRLTEAMRCAKLTSDLRAAFSMSHRAINTILVICGIQSFIDSKFRCCLEGLRRGRCDMVERRVRSMGQSRRTRSGGGRTPLALAVFCAFQIGAALTG